MCQIIENSIVYITNNSKDFFNILFWIFTGILAFLTYKNAKKTLFNPIRSETVKYQMKIITEFVDKHTSRGYSFDSSIDYSNLLRLNFETDYLFDILTNEQKFENHIFDESDESRLNFCKENIGGLFEIRQKEDKLVLEAIYGDFDDSKLYVQTELIKEKEKMFKQLVVQRFYISKRFYEFFTDLVNLETNPFIPEEIKNEISIIISNIYKNIGELYRLLSKNISEQNIIKYQTIYLEFETNKIDHNKDLINLRHKISNYFKVNKM